MSDYFIIYIIKTIHVTLLLSEATVFPRLSVQSSPGSRYNMG